MFWFRVRDAIRTLTTRPLTIFWDDRRGSIATISAIAIPVLVGITGLVAELGHGLLTKAENQRVSDLAAYAGALAYSASCSTTCSTTTMTNAAKSVAVLNGVAASAVTVNLTASPRGGSSQAVFVKIATTNLVLLAPFTGRSSLAIGANAYAQIGGSASAQGCIIALSASGTGVMLSGGTTISATGCAVASNNTVSVPCGTYIAAKAVTYATSYTQGCAGGITATTLTKATATDPISGNTGVSTATARISTVNAMTSPASPTAPSVAAGTDLAFSYYPTTMNVSGCSGTLSGSTWTLNCAGGGTYNFGNLTIGGGLSVNVTGGNASTTYNFSGCVFNSGSALSFGAGNFNIAKGIATGGGTTTTFGAGTYRVGASTAACNSLSNYPTSCIGYSICNPGASLTFAGPSTFSLSSGILTSGSSTLTMGSGQTNTFNVGSAATACNNGGIYSLCNLSSGTTAFGSSGSASSTFSFSAGIYNSGGSTLTLGTGAANSFKVGASSDGNAVYAGGGSTTTFADATGGSSVFQMNGNFNVASGGGSCMTISAAAQHDINGYFATAGGTLLGAGVYTIDGYIGLGSNGGGDVTCSGATVGMSGTNVTLVSSGVSTMSSGSCSGLSFCLAGGYNNVTLTAPTAGIYTGLAVIGPASSSRGSGANLTEGANNTSISGVFYYPNGAVSLSGGASIGNGSGQCLTLIGTQVSLSGGTTAASSCALASSSPASTTISLVQ